MAPRAVGWRPFRERAGTVRPYSGPFSIGAWARGAAVGSGDAGVGRRRGAPPAGRWRPQGGVCRKAAQPVRAERLSFWKLGYPDSNQERQDQNLQCYHYTIPQTYAPAVGRRHHGPGSLPVARKCGAKVWCFFRTAKFRKAFFDCRARKACRGRLDGAAVRLAAWLSEGAAWRGAWEVCSAKCPAACRPGALRERGCSPAAAAGQVQRGGGVAGWGQRKRTFFPSSMYMPGRVALCRRRPERS